MDTEALKVTPEEITKFRSELTDNPGAIATLDTIQECEGYLEDAIRILMIRETGTTPARNDWRDWLKKCSEFICQDEVREALESGLIGPAIEPISIHAGIPPGTATAISICAFKLGMKNVCSDSKPKAL